MTEKLWLWQSYKTKQWCRALWVKAVRNGNMVRPRMCSECKTKNSPISGHHPDYTKPLQVVWLCHKCHKKIHRGDVKRCRTKGHEWEDDRWVGKCCMWCGVKNPAKRRKSGQGIIGKFAVLNAEYLEEAREDALASMTDFARIIGIHPVTYTKILKGKKVSEVTIMRILRHLDVDKERLLNSTQ